MARRSQAPEPPDPGQLRVSRHEASERIGKQITEGEALLAHTPRTEQELDAAREKRSGWSDYNKMLLQRLFTSASVSSEYSASPGGSFSLHPSFPMLVGYWRDSLQTSISRLRSIHQRLDLFEEPVSPTTAPLEDRQKVGDVFLVHGRNNEAKEMVARFLERSGLKVTILHEQPDRGRTIIEKFEAHALTGYAVVLLTGDDIGGLRTTPTDLKPRARQNVLLELGYFLGALGRDRVCALREDGVEVPSDLAGVLYTDIDVAGAWKQKLASEIKAAGFPVDLNRWLT